MLADPDKWPYQFGLTYSITLSNNELETSLVVRNTGSTNYDFHVLFHTYLAVDVSEAEIFFFFFGNVTRAVELHMEKKEKRDTMLIRRGGGKHRT